MTIPPITAATSDLVSAIGGSAWAERMGWALVHSLWQFALVAAVLAVVLWLLRRASPNIRYIASCIALLVMAVLPAATSLLMQSADPLPRPGAVNSVVDATNIPAVPGRRFSAADDGMFPATDSVAASPSSEAVATMAHTQAALSEIPRRATPIEPAQEPSNFQDRLRPALPWIVIAWMAGVCFSSARLCCSCFALQRLRKQSSFAASEELVARLAGLAKRIGIFRPVRLLESARVEVPTVFGWLKPVILLPASTVTGLSSSQLESLLAHELAHVRRHDYLVNLMQNVLEVLLYYHPAAWWVSARIRQEREHCCDDVAAEVCGDPVGYAEALLRMEELRPVPNRFAVAASGGDLVRRVRRLVGAPERSGIPSWWAAGLISLLIIATPLVVLRADPDPASPEADSGTVVVSESEEGAASKQPDLVGTVTSPDGKPVPEAAVFIYSAGVRTGTDTLCPSCYRDCAKRTTTDDEGRFRIPELDPQLLFRVLVAARDYEPTFATKVDPGVGPLSVTVKPRPAEAVDRSLSIRGHVFDDQGHPVLGAVLSPQSVRNGRVTSFGTNTLDPIAVTDKDGLFVVAANEPFEAATFLVEARGMANEVSREFSAGETKARIELGPGCVVSGKLLREGQPVVGATVGLVQVNRNSATFLGPKQIGTDERGIFLFDNVGPDEAYSLYALTDSLPDGGATPVKRIVTGLDGTALDTGVLEVMGGHTLAGRVVLADGKPIPPDTRIGLYRDDAWDSSRSELDSEGRFALRGVPGEAVRLGLRVPGYHLSTKNRSYLPLRMNLTGLVDRDRDDLLILLEPGDPEFKWPETQSAQFAGYTRERWLKTQPLEGAPFNWKEISAPDPSKLEDGINRERYQPARKSPATAPASSSNAERSSKPPTRAVTSRSAGTESAKRAPSSLATIVVEGVVREGNQDPIAGATVRMLRDDGGGEGEETGRIETGADGTFRFSDVPISTANEKAIRYLVVVTKPELSSAVRYVSTDAARKLEITLLPPALLRGRVLDERGNGIAGALVHRLELAGKPIPGVWSTVSTKDGYYEITDLPPWRASEESAIEHGIGFPTSSKSSRMIYTVSKPGYATELAKYGELPATIDVTLKPAAIIEGRVLDAVTGKPAAGAIVRAQGIEFFRDGGARAKHGGSAITDENGRYRLDSLEGGTFNIWAKLPGRVVAPIAAFPAAVGEVSKAPDLVMTEGGFITGRVVDVDTGEPVSRTPWGSSIRVAASSSEVRGGIVLDSVPVEDDGTFEIRAAPGPVHVYVQLSQDNRDRSIRSSTSVEAKSGETMPLPSFRIRVPEPETN